MRGASLGAVILLASCSAEAREERRGQEIAVCGELFPIGTRVVLWSDPGGYDAYSLVPRFAEAETQPDGILEVRPRFGQRRNLPADLRRRVTESGWKLEDLQQIVCQFVLHYDAAAASRQCFKVLHDLRKLSVHFLLDVDGTIYQTLDLRERAWHGGVANDHSIGIEIAQIGAFTAPGHPYLRSYYAVDPDGGVRVRFPAWMKETGVRTPDFVARPSRDGLFDGEINGRRVWQYDFTEEQYRALIKLTATLARLFPGIELRVPRDADGSVRTTVLDGTELGEFNGVLGHYHVSETKRDPGPSMDWERVLREAAEPPASEVSAR